MNSSAKTEQRKSVVLEDPQHPGLAAAVEAKGFVFLSAVDGDHSCRGVLDPEAFGNGPAQARNAYGTLVERLRAIGLDGWALCRIEHVTASQDWRLERMALWPEHFGRPTQAVSQGFQGRMVGQNMITVTGIATRPELEREVVAAGPNDGRAARIVRAGPFLFVIGVRGEIDLATGERASEEIDGAFAQQIHFAYRNIEHWLSKAGASRDDLVRYDAFIRDIGRAMEHRAARTEHFSGQMTVASTVVGCPLGGRTDLELSGIATLPGDDARETTYIGGRGDLAQAVRVGGFAFASGMLGNRGVDGKIVDSAVARLEPQLDLARARLEASLETVRARWDDIVRLDIYVRDPMRHDTIRAWLRDNFTSGAGPAYGIYGVELEPGCEVELTAIAAT